jgi:hypothetical protein
MLFGQVPYWVLGVFGLGVVWVNAFLIAAAAWAEARRLLREKNALGDIKQGKVVRGDGEDGALGVHEIDQVGRAVDAPVPTIAWHDRGHSSEFFGGAVEADGKEIDIKASKGDDEIWPARERQIECARCPGDADLDALYKSSRGAKGALRKVRTPIKVGDVVFVARKGKLVSAIEPRAWYAAKIRAAILFSIAELAVCGALTAVALQQPHFGLISTFGGAGLLLFFVFVQPLGVTVEESNRAPSKTLLRGEWQRSAAV